MVVGLPGSTVAWQLLSAVAVLFAGQVIVGAAPSVTVTVKLQLAPVVPSSVALTTVVPTGKKQSLQ